MGLLGARAAASAATCVVDACGDSAALMLCPAAAADCSLRIVEGDVRGFADGFEGSCPQ